MKDIYICDIDGTLANNNHRNPFDESKVILDTALPTTKIIQSLGEENIIFFSGRTEGCRKDTTNWLVENLLLLYPPKLYMRQIGDNRPDEVIKKELYESYIKDKYNVIGIFDDRLKVCRMWYSLGLFVFNCNQGLKEF